MAENSGPPAASRPAQRLTRKRWSDPRLLVGIVLVAVAVVAGAMIIEASDDTTSVWALRVDAHAGESPELSDLERVDVHVGESVVERYVSGGEEVLTERLENSAWAHDVPAGELLAVSALSRRDDAGVGELPLSVAVGSMPTDLQSGQRVDVWVAPERAGGDRASAERVLERVRVRAVRAPPAALGEGASRTVLIAVDQATVDELGPLLARVGRGAVTLVRVGAAEAP